MGRKMPHILVSLKGMFRGHLCREELEAQGYTVETAGDGSRAWEILSHQAGRLSPFDVVVVDEVMGGISGSDFIRTARMSHNDVISNTPILLVASPRVIDPGEAVKRGAYALIRAPINYGELVYAIEEIASKKRVVA